MSLRLCLARASSAVIGLVAMSVTMAVPSIYPTGTTIYDPDRAWNGYTILIAPEEIGAVLIDMNGNTLKIWEGFNGATGGPARVLPGGHAIAAGPPQPPHQETNILFQQDWDGETVWSFERNERVEAANGSMIWSARQHHDWQREGLPGGYYSPEADPEAIGGRTLVLTHTNVVVPSITPRALEDDRLIEVSWDGEIVWEWKASDHVNELGIPADMRAVIARGIGHSEARGSLDWLHINSATYIGPNRWYDAGDQRFHPDNIMISGRYINMIAIVSHEDGSITWRLGPDYQGSLASSRIGQIIGQHNPHIIPKGLPGAGNLLVFDNGDAAAPNDVTDPSPFVLMKRPNSRVLEINPQTFEVVWSYSMPGREAFKFYSHYISNIQRLENGNTMITEGADGRLFEVTTDGTIVWEYVNPYFAEREAPSNAVYRAYRLPYDWIPQLDRPRERAVVPPDLSEFRVPTR